MTQEGIASETLCFYEGRHNKPDAIYRINVIHIHLALFLWLRVWAFLGVVHKVNFPRYRRCETWSTRTPKYR